MILVAIRYQSNFPNTNRLPSRVHNVTSYMLRDIGSEAPILWETHHMQISCYVVPCAYFLIDARSTHMTKKCFYCSRNQITISILRQFSVNIFTFKVGKFHSYENG